MDGEDQAQISGGSNLENFASKSIEDLAVIPVVATPGNPPRIIYSRHNSQTACLDFQCDETLTTEYWVAEFERRKCCARAVTCWASVTRKAYMLWDTALNDKIIRFCMCRHQRAMAQSFESWAEMANVQANLTSLRAETPEVMFDTTTSCLISGKEPNVRNRQNHSCLTDHASFQKHQHPSWEVNMSHRAKGANHATADGHGRMSRCSSLERNKQDVDDRDIFIDVNDVVWQQGKPNQQSRYLDPNSCLDKQQHDALIQDIMRAALVGPQYLEEKLLYLYESGELDDGECSFLWAFRL